MKAPGSGPAAGDREPSLTSRTLAGLKWASLTSGGQTLLSIATVMILSRLLSPEDFGRIAVALIFLALAETAGRQSVGPALVQRFDLSERHVATGFTLSLAIGVVLGAALWGLAPLAGRLIAEPGLAPILETLSLAAILTGLGVVPEHLLRRHLRFRALMTAAIVSQALGNGLVAIVLALLGYGVWALVWGMLARQAVFTLVVVACQPPPRRLRLAAPEVAELLRTATGFSAIALLNVVSWHGVHFVIARILGPASLGLYTRAHRLALVPASPGPVLTNVLLPAMARRQRQPERLRAVQLHGVEMLSLAALPASLAIAVAAPEIVSFVLGGQWDAAVPALRILALTGALQACNAVHVCAIRAMGAVYRETWRRALFVLVLVGATWLASGHGLAAIAAAVACARLFIHLLLARLTLSLLGLRWRDLLPRHLPALWASLWATPVLWLAGELARDASLPVFAALPLELVAWGAAAAAAIWFAPPFARPSFAHWGLAQLPFNDMGRSGRHLRAVLALLARRWPAPPRPDPR